MPDPETPPTEEPEPEEEVASAEDPRNSPAFETTLEDSSVEEEVPEEIPKKTEESSADAAKEEEDIPSTDPEPAKPVMELGALRALSLRQKGHHGSTPARNDFTKPPSDDGGPSPAAPSQFDHTSFLDDLSDGKVRNFDDLFSRYPIGDGAFQIYVERRHPTVYRGINVGGMQKPIESVIDHEKFASRYGSGTYMLTVYGPLQGNRKGADGQMKRKAYTRPIKVVVPDPFSENPPNPEMAAVAVAEEVEMNAYSGMRRGGATDADAEIEKAKLEHESSKEERQRLWEERQREREERKAREQEEKEEARAEEERSREMSQLRIMEGLLKSRDQELRELRNQPSKDVTAFSFMPDLLRAVKPEGPSKDEIQRLTSLVESERTQKTEEISRLRENHTAELLRLRDEHTKEMERFRSEMDRNLRDERERNERLVRDKEESARRQIEDARNEATRRVTELRESYEARLSDERRQHDRDLQTAQSMNNTNSSTLSSSFEMRLEVKQQEINRLSKELSRVQSELTEEKSKTLADRVGEFAGAAEALGYSKEEGEKGWKEMLGEAAVGLVQNVPALAANISASLRGNNQPAMLPAHVQAQAGMVPPNYGPVFATDGVEMDMDYPNQPQQPLYPGQDPNEYYDDEEGEEEDLPHGGPTPSTPPMPQPQTQAVAAPPQGVATPAQQQAIAQAQKNVQADPNSMNVTDDQIIEFSEMFRGALSQGASPEEFAQNMLTQLGPLMAGSIVREIPLKRVSTVLQAAPGGDKDPLVRRDGQKFLTKVWELVKSRTEQSVAAQ